MNALKVCHRCGADLALDAPIFMNDFAMNGAGFPLIYDGKQVPLTNDEAQLCWALMKAYPHFLTVEILVERLGSEAENPNNLIRAHISRIRRKLAGMGAPHRVIATPIWGSHAYVWDPKAAAA
jgi:DNA-binding response OmpR family regulator